MKINRKYASKMYWGVFFLLVLLKYAYYNFHYYPVLDDWIQYGAYSLSHNPFVDIILKSKMYTIRPLANLSDVYLLGKLWNHMGILFFVITLMHAFSGYFLFRIFEYNRIKVGYIFLIIYGLLPFGAEATYWISASSRIIVGTFFATLAVFFMCRYIFESEKKPYLAMFFIFQLISFGYYEPVTVLEIVACALIVVSNFKKTSSKEAGLITVINGAIIAFYYSYFLADSQLANRAQRLYDTAPVDNKKIFCYICEMLNHSDLYFYLKGLKRGIEIINGNKQYFFIALMLLIFFVVYLISLFDKREKIIFQNVKKMLLGVILFVAPFTVFFFVNSNWVSYRNAFTSFIGFGLVVESLVDIVASKGLMIRVRAILTGIVVVSFIIINISELSDYRTVSIIDYKITSGIIKITADDAYIKGYKQALLFNVSNSYTELNREFHEHINNVTKSSWSLTGTIRCVAKDVSIKNIFPIELNMPFRLPTNKISNYVLFGIEDDLDISLLTYQRKPNSGYYLYTTNGQLFGEIEYRWDAAFFIRDSKKGLEDD